MEADLRMLYSRTCGWRDSALEGGASRRYTGLLEISKFCILAVGRSNKNAQLTARELGCFV